MSVESPGRTRFLKLSCLRGESTVTCPRCASSPLPAKSAPFRRGGALVCERILEIDKSLDWEESWAKDRAFADTVGCAVTPVVIVVPP